MSIKVLTIIFASGILIPLATVTALSTFADNDANATASRPTQTAKETQQDVTAPKPAVKKEDLPNFHEVHPFLFRGGEPNEAGLQKLKDMGIATIIDLRAPSEMKFNERDSAQKLGMRYINLVMDSQAPTEKQVDEMMKEIDKSKTLSEQGEKNKSVFVHCAHGSDRTGCMIGIWRVTRDGYDYPTAYKEMRKYYFTPKFTRLSGSVEQYAAKAHASNGENGGGSNSKEQ
jgi:protein tyrosine/serine phosphatase